MDKKFFSFIVLVRALAAMIITNSHYTGVYPTDLIANGGLLGDCLFFAVSGFCLANSNGPFLKWYGKRFLRVYVPMWMLRISYILLGIFVLTKWSDIIKYFIFPQDWHFVSSLILLYIPLFCVSKYVEMNFKNYGLIAGGLFVLQLALYLLVYDYSFYHIDTVREPMIEFLFFQSMLLGVHFRWRCENENRKDTLTVRKVAICVILCALYFTSKLSFVSTPSIAPFQILNQVLLFGLLYVIFDIFMNLESVLNKHNNGLVWKGVTFISDRTLEIYLVQYVIIANCNIGPFPINWLIITFTILTSAAALRYCSQLLITRIKL